MIKLAFGSVPKDGGTYTFYRNMRPALLKHGIEMRCVAVGKDQAELWEEDYVDEGCVLLSPHTRNIKKQAQAFATWCAQESIDVVMGINSEAILSALPHLPEGIRCMARCANSFDHGYRITLSGYERLAGIIAQTPRQLKDLTQTYGADPEKIAVIPNGIDPDPFGGTRDEGRGTRAEAGGRRPDADSVESRGTRAEGGGRKSDADSVESRGSSVEGGGRKPEDSGTDNQTTDSPSHRLTDSQSHSLTDSSRYALRASQDTPSHRSPLTAHRSPLTAAKPPPIRLGFLGRLEHKQKGVLFLPEIVRELNKLEVHFTLRIAGKGRHEEKLKIEMGKADTHSPPSALRHPTSDIRPPTSDIQFLGALPPGEIPAFLAETDIFLFPSQFEGCPNALLEAMMTGCVPVSWRLEGITDFIIEDGVSGAVVDLGDCASFAEKVAAYASSPEKLAAASRQAAGQAAARFSTEVAAKNYANTIQQVMKAVPPAWTPRPWSAFQADPNFEHSWRDWIPKPWKLALRRAMGREA